MKLNKEQLENLKSKEYFQSEGIIGRVFARLLKKRLAKDKNLQKAVDKMDKSSEDLKKSIQKLPKDGVKIPDELLVYAGLKRLDNKWQTKNHLEYKRIRRIVKG